MDALLWELLADGSPDDRVEVLIKLSELGHVPADRIEVVAQIGKIVSCRIRRGDIEAVRELEGVVSMKASRTLSIDLPYSEDQIAASEYLDYPKNDRRPKLPYTGKGIAIGITDWGVDFTHPNFVNADNTSRFLAIWDQGADYDGVNRYGYGTIHYKSDINDALDSASPFETLGYHPGKTDFFHQGMHGSHVLDIAAGNGTIGDKGIAPDADLIAVHLSTNRFKDLMGLGDSVRVFDGLHFIDDLAGEQPLVINMSVGSHGDAHAGLTLIEQAIDALITAKMNRSIVQSSGNYYKGHTHSKGVLTTQQTTILEWLISDKDKTSNEIEIWYEPDDTIEIDMQSPNGDFVLTKQGIGHTTIQNDRGDTVGRYYHRAHEPNTQLHQVFIILTEQAAAGKWQIILRGVHIVNGRYQAWIERDVKGSVHQSRFPLYQANTDTTTGSICNGYHTICVGAYDANDAQQAIGVFSSVGPTWDGRQKPDLVAPGVNILAAKSASPYQNQSEGELTQKTGTSMAAPHVTGAVALMYEAAQGPLSINAVKQALFAACEPPTTALSSQGSKRYGQGILNIEQLFVAYSNTQTAIETFEEIAIEDSIDDFNEAQFDDFIETDFEDFIEIDSSEADFEETDFEEVYFEDIVDDITEPDFNPPFFPPKKENKMAKQYYDRYNTAVTSLMEACHEEYPELRSNNLADYFENLPSERTAWDGGLDVQRGDVLVRRQYGHHEPAWYGVVEWVEGNRAQVHTLRGRKTVSLTKDGQRMDKELKRIRPQYEIEKELDVQNSSDFEAESVSNYEEALKKPLLKFLVNFRRPKKFTRTNGDTNESKNEVVYEGHFGFDWLRDEYIYPIETVSVDLDSNPLNIKTPLCTDVVKLKIEYSNDVSNPIAPYKKEYYPAWLSIFPPRGIKNFGHGSRMHEQGVRLSLEIDEIDVLNNCDNTIQFKCDNPLLKITPSEITLSHVVKKGKKQTTRLDSVKGISRTFWYLEDAILIKSGKGLLDKHTEIKVIAKGADKEEEVGKLMVYQNDRIPKAELVLVRVSYDDGNINLSSQYHDILKNQTLNQALIRTEIIEDEKFIINSLNANDADVKKFKTDFPDGNRHPATKFLDALVRLYEKFGKNFPPVGSTRSIIFITNQNGSAGGVTQSELIGGKFKWGNAVAVFNANLSSKSSFVHEIGHSLSLPHTFSKNPAAGNPHRFYRGYTDNIMDYEKTFDSIDNPNERQYFFKWQWDIMRRDQSLTDVY